MDRLEKALGELEALQTRAKKIQSLDQFEEALGETSVPEKIKTSMINICRRSCPIPSPAPELFVFYVQEVLDWGIDEIQNYSGKES